MYVFPKKHEVIGKNTEKQNINITKQTKKTQINQKKKLKKNTSKLKRKNVLIYESPRKYL